MLRMFVAALLAGSAPALLCAEEVSQARPAGAVVVAQGAVTIPSDAQMERMEERAITTDPLDVSEARGVRGGEEAEIQQMDRRAHRIDERLLKDDGICAGC
jgi:hypothetical protein